MFIHTLLPFLQTALLRFSPKSRLGTTEKKLSKVMVMYYRHYAGIKMPLLPDEVKTFTTKELQFLT